MWVFLHGLVVFIWLKNYKYKLNRPRTIYIVLSLNYLSVDLIPCTNSAPCQHGATCTDTGAGGYICTCAAGYTGVNCEAEINECDSIPCQNGGTCTVRYCIMVITYLFQIDLGYAQWLQL